MASQRQLCENHSLFIINVYGYSCYVWRLDVYNIYKTYKFRDVQLHATALNCFVSPRASSNDQSALASLIQDLYTGKAQPIDAGTSNSLHNDLHKLLIGKHSYTEMMNIEPALVVMKKCLSQKQMPTAIHNLYCEEHIQLHTFH